jgi:uncharacterized protein YdbL (DUF1318 family)
MKRTKQAWLALLVLAFALPALALDLAEARATGAVGERADGYVAARTEKPAEDVKALVADVNAKRRAAYEEIAKRNGTPVEAVAALAGQKLIAAAPAGQWVDEGSGWRKK